MKYLRYSFLFIGLLAVASCNETVKWQEAQNEGYRIRIPDYMEYLGEEVNPDADIAYGDKLKEVYTMVVKEPTADVDSNFVYMNDPAYPAGIDGYTQFVLDYYKDGGDEIVKSVTPVRNETIGELQCRMFEMETLIEGHERYYALNIVRGRDTYYQFSTWTFSDRKDKYKKTMNDILHSIEETDSSASH